ncbi:MAG TPA: ABC transporter ATP-binding protein [Acidimicrobiales bacterium]|nr:ABC transporter ATP-binding protein [Acidimicrobiales bacterium]
MGEFDIKPGGWREMTWGDRLRPIVAVATISFKADPARATLSLVLRLAGAASPPIFALALASLVDAARPGAPASQALISAMVMAAAIAATVVLDEIGWKVTQILEERTAHLVDRDILSKMAGLPGLDHLERPENLDKIQRIEQEHWLLSMSVTALLNMAVLLFGVAVSIILLARLHPAMLLLPLLAIPGLFAGHRAERLRWRVLDEHAGDWRRVYDWLELGTKVAPAKELRVFGLGPEVIRRQREVSEGMEAWERDHRVKGALMQTSGRVVFALGYVAAIAFVAERVRSGDMGVPDLVLAVVLAGQAMQSLVGLTGNVNWVTWTFSAVRRWLWFLDYEKRQPRGDGVAAPDRIADGIRVENVSFRYPGIKGADGWALRDADLFLPAGSTVALVGENGAGKTTLVKLLCRFYEPTEGRVTIDGVDLSTIDVTSWRNRVGAAFQDHARLELKARDAITVGEMARFGDDAAAVAALERAGSVDVLRALPEGLDTQLGAEWAGGVELSGGEWQKIALGRAMMRDDPLLLIMDEPTAALDAETEHRLFERYAETSNALAESQGTITVLVSHRFSTVRMADVIIVVGDGHIIETGSHEELVSKPDGVYAELYNMQARAYR